MSSLKNLNKVGNNLKIIDNAKMDDLDINNLEEVGSDATILNNPNLNLKPRSL